MTSPGAISADRFRLMLITDPALAPASLRDAVVRAVRGGVTIVQVRDTDATAQLALARDLREPLRNEGALLVVNDRLDLVRESGADGVHLKRSSVSPAVARRELGPHAVVGVSTHSPEEVETAFALGADYVVFGPVFDTPSKAGLLEPRGAAAYHRVAAAHERPVLALGGITEKSLRRLAGGPVPGVAAIRALVCAPDPEAAARRFRGVLG
jgi:thiamine-phosphate pyrophosphorylase